MCRNNSSTLNNELSTRKLNNNAVIQQYSYTLPQNETKKGQ